MATLNKRFFSVDKASSYWKKIPSKTFIAGEEKSMPGFKASKDRLALLSGANEASDFNWSQCLFTTLKTLRPLRITQNLGTSLVVWWLRLHSSTVGDMGLNPGSGFKTPHAVLWSQKKKKKNAKSTASVFYKWHSKIWMRAYHFTTLFTEYFKCIIKKFCSEKKRFLSRYYCSLTVHLVTQELWWRCTMR